MVRLKVGGISLETLVVLMSSVETISDVQDQINWHLTRPLLPAVKSESVRTHENEFL